MSTQTTEGSTTVFELTDRETGVTVGIFSAYQIQTMFEDWELAFYEQTPIEE